MWAYICVSLLLQTASWLAMPQVGDPFYPGEWADTDDVYEEPDNALTDWLLFILGTIAVRIAISGITHIYHSYCSTKRPVGEALKRRLPKVTTIITKDPAACLAAMYASPKSRPASPLAAPIPSQLWNNVLTRPLAYSRRRSASAPAAPVSLSTTSSVTPIISPMASIDPERNNVLTQPFWHQLADLPAPALAASAASSPPLAGPGPIAGGSPPPSGQRNAGFTTSGAPSDPVMAAFYRLYPKTGTKHA